MEINPLFNVGQIVYAIDDNQLTAFEVKNVNIIWNAIPNEVKVSYYLKNLRTDKFAWMLYEDGRLFGTKDEVVKKLLAE